VLEPQDHQCPQRSAEEGPAKGGRAAESDAVCGDERRLRAAARCIRADVPQDGQEGRGDAAQGLGSDGDLLLISA